MELIKNEPKYWEFIRKLRNNNSNESINQEFITKEKQKKYMKKNGNYFYICILNNIPTGYIRIINNDIGLIVDKNYRRKGIALFMVKEVMKLNPKAFAKIKIWNKKSIELFKKAGFKLSNYIYEYAPDLNSRSFNEDSLNKGYEVNQK